MHPKLIRSSHDWKSPTGKWSSTGKIPPSSLRKSMPGRCPTSVGRRRRTFVVFGIQSPLNGLGVTLHRIPTTLAKIHRRELVRALWAELFATTILVYCATGSAAATGQVLGDGSGAPLKANVARLLPIATASGVSVSVLAFSFQAISGAHMNPVVTLAMVLYNKFDPVLGLLYCLVQFVGSVLGVLLLWACISGVSWNPPKGMDLTGFVPGMSVIPSVGYPPFALGLPLLSPLITPANGLLLETMGTMILVLTVLLVGLNPKYVEMAPLPIGFVVWVLNMVLIPWTGCGINPARVFGAMFVNLVAEGEDGFGVFWWVYYLGPLLGSLLAVGLAKFLTSA
ncbi:hypothetical protein BASA81_006728 [Batrachochytrium salamandrivorans]|nr:hypothetical protein BASA81_006728 [Batrachochytrium salamandrivorans]